MCANAFLFHSFFVSHTSSVLISAVFICSFWRYYYCYFNFSDSMHTHTYIYIFIILLQFSLEENAGKRVKERESSVYLSCWLLLLLPTNIHKKILIVEHVTHAINITHTLFICYISN